MSTWDQEVQIIGWENLVTPELLDKDWDTIKSQVPDVLRADAKVHCTCPAFSYWGHAYNLTNIDTALYPNTIPPSAVNDRGELSRDPDERHGCKHLISVIKAFFQ
jgi:hypothetical protein